MRRFGSIGRTNLQIAVAVGVICALSTVGVAKQCVPACRAALAQCKLAECAGRAGRDRSDCVRTCRIEAGCDAPFTGTVAYVRTTCQSDAAGIRVGQVLEVRHGRCTPQVIFEIPPAAPLPDPFDLCWIFAQGRNGVRAKVAGGFQRVAVSRDGNRVAFELNSAVALFPVVNVAPEVAGLYVANTDGSDLRRVAEPTRVATFGLYPDPSGPLGLTGLFWGTGMSFHPGGHVLLLSDLGVGANGDEAPQVVTIDVVTGQRFQVTRLDRVSMPVARTDVLVAGFMNRRTIQFAGPVDPDGSNPDGEWRYFAVRLDGSHVRSLPIPVISEDAKIQTTFEVAGGGRRLHEVDLPGEPENFLSGEGETIQEVFVVDGNRLLQLTGFGRSDTQALLVARHGRRAFIGASTNVLGTNPSGVCQIFSLDLLGRALQQLTFFDLPAPSQTGCFNLDEAGCGVWTAWEGKRGELLFFSTCDYRRKMLFGGQYFAMRPDGSKLRQLTTTAGLTNDGETITVELPGIESFTPRR